MGNEARRWDGSKVLWRRRQQTARAQRGQALFGGLVRFIQRGWCRRAGSRTYPWPCGRPRQWIPRHPRARVHPRNLGHTAHVSTDPTTLTQEEKRVDREKEEKQFSRSAISSIFGPTRATLPFTHNPRIPAYSRFFKNNWAAKYNLIAIWLGQHCRF
jgi:hypothetical protein